MRRTQRGRKTQGKKANNAAPRDQPPQNLKRPLRLMTAPTGPGLDPKQGSGAECAEGCNNTEGTRLRGRPSAMVVAWPRADSARSKETSKREGGMAGQWELALSTSCAATATDDVPYGNGIATAEAGGAGTEDAEREGRKAGGPTERGEMRRATASEATGPIERGGELRDGSLWASATPLGVGRDCGTTNGMHRGMPMWRPLSG